MGSVYKPFLYGSRTPENVLAVLEDWIDWHAYRLACTAPGQVDNLYYQDLAQEGRLAVYRLLEREPHIWAPKLLRLAILAMYTARRRGRSGFRADPSHANECLYRSPSLEGTGGYLNTMGTMSVLKIFAMMEHGDRMKHIRRKTRCYYKGLY